MFDQIARILMTITNYMDNTEMLTKKLTNEVTEESINDFINGIDNRDRLIKIVGKFNTTLDQTLAKVPDQQYKVLHTVLLQHYFQDLEIWKTKMALLDEMMMEKVQHIREAAQKEIRSTFDTKNKIVGYNLRSTK